MSCLVDLLDPSPVVIFRAFLFTVAEQLGRIVEKNPRGLGQLYLLLEL